MTGRRDENGKGSRDGLSLSEDHEKYCSDEGRFPKDPQRYQELDKADAEAPLQAQGIIVEPIVEEVVEEEVRSTSEHCMLHWCWCYDDHCQTHKADKEANADWWSWTYDDHIEIHKSSNDDARWFCKKRGAEPEAPPQAQSVIIAEQEAQDAVEKQARATSSMDRNEPGVDEKSENSSHCGDCQTPLAEAIDEQN